MANQEIDKRSSKIFYFAGDLATVTDAIAQAGTFSTPIATDLGSCDKVGALLAVTAITAGAAGDLLDVAVQTTLNPFDAVPFWFDVIAFSQINLNGLAVPHYQAAQITHGQATSFNPATALAAGSNRQSPGVQYRIKYTVTEGATADLRVTFRVILRAIGS